MSQAIIGRWGKNLAVRFPADVANAARLTDGERVEVLVHKQEVIIRKVIPTFTAGEMFRGRSPEEWRKLYVDAYDWGADRGGEIVDG